MAKDPSSSSSANLTKLYTHLQTLIKKWVYDKTEVDNKLSNKLDKAQTSYKGKNIIVDSSSGNIAFEDKNNHTHTKSQITDFPTIPSKTSQLTNDSGFLTSHQSLSNYYNKSETNNYDVDFILGTQTASTSAWTGTTNVISSLRAGTTIFYKLPYASTSTSVTLNLTLKGGGTTGAKNVFYKNTTRLTTHFGVGQVVGLTYDGTAWYVISPSDNNSNNDSNYGGIQFKAGEALTTQTICCAKNNGQYYKVANGVVLDIRYPLIMTSNAVTSGTTTNAMYRTWYGVNIANTKSMTLTNGSQLFLEGTAYSDGKFTISSNVVTHTLTNGRYYIKVGTALSTTQIRFISDMTVYYYNGTTLKPVIKKEQIVDFPTIPSASSTTPLADTTNGSVGDGTTWARSNHTHPKSSLYAEASHTHSQYLTAHQDITGKEDKSNKVTSLSSSSTDTEYPSAKAVYDATFNLDTLDCINENFTLLSLPQIILTHDGNPFDGSTVHILEGYDKGAYVDWGDGTPIETYESTDTLKHSYSDSVREHIITIYGDILNLCNNSFANFIRMTSINIPSGVTSLGDYCFNGCTGLTSVTIPSSVTSLGNNCFNSCSSLTSVTIPNGVRSLGVFCFNGCTGLTSVVIPSSVISLGNSCFNSCSSLTSVTIPSSVTSLGNSCFSSCSSLTSVTIPNGVTSLGDDCFRYCSALTNVTIPSSVISLGGNCFGGCTNLVDYQLYWETPPVNWYSTRMPNNADTYFTIPNGTTANYTAKGFPSDKLVERSE